MAERQDLGEGPSAAGTRVRRSARTPAKAPAKVPVAAAPPESPLKRKARDAEKGPEERLEYLLTNAKSRLTRVDISVSPLSAPPCCPRF